MVQSEVQALIQQQGLPNSFETLVENFYLPLSANMARAFETRKQQTPDAGTWLVGVQGTQGSGKSTCSLFMKHLLETEFNLSVVVLSIDDFYLTRQERITLSKTVHPLLKTRGVPGTHDVSLILSTLDQLKNLSEHEFMLLPRFDKATDDRKSKAKWDEVEGPVDVILFEGWCVGIHAEQDQSLEQAINDLEAAEDKDGVWRQYVNEQLKDDYANLFAQLEELLVIQAPSFDVVHNWRLLQEEKLKAKMAHKGVHNLKLMTSEEIKHFISHYQRLTQHALTTLAKRARWVLHLDAEHNIDHMNIMEEATE